ncbi:hypothetical protein BUALT_Bualt09G0082900 [Buddleja alternifolia]|uniref:Uncharacterized protein n=1 Tax=Buddleja alternifolia TaxID=168488 RepID=A0AAV6X5A3_9LAMI|nr:hypothetical protein BUALT_Bualt09G0082900 [Buddleja alternifolia]
MLAQHGVTTSFVTTPHNAARLAKTIHRARKSGLHIHLIEIPFPCQEVGLPPGCENLDSVPARNLIRNFYSAMDKIQQPLEKYLQENGPPPSCIISDKCLSWTSQTAKKFKVPRLVFHGMCCFSLLSSHNVKLYRPHVNVKSDTEPFLIPGMPVRVEIAKNQLPGWGDEEKVGVLVKREQVGNAINMLMDGGEEGEMRRKMSEDLKLLAMSKMENGGSAHVNISVLIEDIKEQSVLDRDPL